MVKPLDILYITIEFYLLIIILFVDDIINNHKAEILLLFLQCHKYIVQ